MPRLPYGNRRRQSAQRGQHRTGREARRCGVSLCAGGALCGGAPGRAALPGAASPSAYEPAHGAARPKSTSRQQGNYSQGYIKKAAGKYRGFRMGTGADKARKGDGVEPGGKRAGAALPRAREPALRRRAGTRRPARGCAAEGQPAKRTGVQPSPIPKGRRFAKRGLRQRAPGGGCRPALFHSVLRLREPLRQAGRGHCPPWNAESASSWSRPRPAPRGNARPGGLRGRFWPPCSRWSASRPRRPRPSRPARR